MKSYQKTVITQKRPDRFKFRLQTSVVDIQFVDGCWCHRRSAVLPKGWQPSNSNRCGNSWCRQVTPKKITVFTAKNRLLFFVWFGLCLSQKNHMWVMFELYIINHTLMFMYCQFKTIFKQLGAVFFGQEATKLGSTRATLEKAEKRAQLVQRCLEEDGTRGLQQCWCRGNYTMSKNERFYQKQKLKQWCPTSIIPKVKKRKLILIVAVWQVHARLDSAKVGKIQALRNDVVFRISYGCMALSESCSSRNTPGR